MIFHFYSTRFSRSPGTPERQCLPASLSAVASTRQGAVELLAEKVAAFERGLDLELTPDITLMAYLRWWTDVELVEQVEDGIITATTRKAYVGQVNKSLIAYDH
jgi:hypothetical protein